MPRSTFDDVGLMRRRSAGAETASPCSSGTSGCRCSSSPRSSAAWASTTASWRSDRCCRSSLDIPFGYRAYGYTLLFAVALLAIVMIGTIGRPRLVRRRLSVPPDRRVLRARAVGRVHQRRAVLVAVPRHLVRPRLAPARDVGGDHRGGGRVCRVLGRGGPVRPLPARAAREFFRSGRLRASAGPPAGDR